MTFPSPPNHIARMEEREGRVIEFLTSLVSQCVRATVYMCVRDMEWAKVGKRCNESDMQRVEG